MVQRFLQHSGGRAFIGIFALMLGMTASLVVLTDDGSTEIETSGPEPSRQVLAPDSGLARSAEVPNDAVDQDDSPQPDFTPGDATQPDNSGGLTGGPSGFSSGESSSTDSNTEPPQALPYVKPPPLPLDPFGLAAGPVIGDVGTPEPEIADTTTTTTTTTTAAPTTTTAAASRVVTTTSTTTTTTTAVPVVDEPEAAATSAARESGASTRYLSASAPTDIPVYDTAWQMLVRGTPTQTDSYFAALKANGFSGAWAGIIHHAPATYNGNFNGGGRVGNLQNGDLVLTPEYIAHVRAILDTADKHGMQVGLVAAWQNLYLPGGGADNGVASSNEVRGTITTNNAYAYGRHIADAFGDHPGVGMWVFGGDAGTNNTEANKAVWREMARGVRDSGNRLEITFHTPTSEFDQLNYAGEPWLDFIAPETGHAQDASTTEAELRTVAAAYKLPVWQGEPRYFNINFDWVNANFRNPGVTQVRDDAQAARDAGVAGYVYGDAGRWTWCAGFGDSTPCNANNIAASFGEGERSVIGVFTP